MRTSVVAAFDEDEPLSDHSPVLLSGVRGFNRGDLDANGTIIQTDVVGVLNYLFDAGATPIDCAGELHPETADVNDNEFLTTADYLTLNRRVAAAGGSIDVLDGCADDVVDDTRGFDSSIRRIPWGLRTSH